MLKFDNVTLDQMQKVEGAVAAAVLEFRNGRVESLIVVFALLRVARQLFNLYPEKKREGLVPVITDFFRNKPTRERDLEEQAADHMLWLPNGDPRRI